MSFNVNFNNNQPMIRESQKSQDGGAGNLGYFQAGEGSEEKKKQNEAGSIFTEDSRDSFQREADLDISEGFSFMSFLRDIYSAIVKMLKGLFNLK